MAVRTAIMKLVKVDASGKIVTKDDVIAKVMRADTVHRVYEAEPGSAPNAANNSTEVPPTLHQYLSLESGDSFTVRYIDQTYIITSDD